MKLSELLQTAGNQNPTLSDVEAYCAHSGLALSAALDAASRSVARQYAAGALGFRAGDAVMNTLFAYASTKGTIPDFMFSVFQAFDAGESYPDKIRDPTPEERFTRPQIAAILANDDAA
jgi:hypothetical protein